MKIINFQIHLSDNLYEIQGFLLIIKCQQNVQKVKLIEMILFQQLFKQIKYNKIFKPNL